MPKNPRFKGLLFAMKQFDWEIARETYSPRRYQWLVENHCKEVTESQYVAEVGLLRAFSLGAHRSKRYCPSSLRGQYKKLVSNFNFFQGTC